ncbi:LuxR C-terminal-related transcriptional regulator [Micromonospora sp. DT31]|uniref:helix-turn-helix transcriptional regulator n=1 Tax=Micromonospora sp. DT31 TaxID=3393434 RepID=UPI003CF2F2C6
MTGSTSQTVGTSVDPSVPTGSMPRGRWAEIQPHLRNLQLDDTAAAVYAYAVHGGQIKCADLLPALGRSQEELRAVVDQLVEMRLLRPVAGKPDWFAPLDPDIAAASLISPLEAEIHHRQTLITSIRAQMEPLRPHFEERQRRHAEPRSTVRTLKDTNEMLGSLHVAVDRCREEASSVRPRRTKWDDSLDAELARDISVLRRGVRLRVLYQHAARADLATRAYIRKITAAGAEVRTTGQAPRPFVVFDNEIAFVPDPAGALEITNSPLARVLCDVFESMWRAALPYRPEEAGYQDAAGEMQITIARLLAEGLTDEVVARRLGISPRSCRRHIAALLKHLNSVSRFQAGILAAKAGMIPDD